MKYYRIIIAAVLAASLASCSTSPGTSAASSSQQGSVSAADSNSEVSASEPTEEYTGTAAPGSDMSIQAAIASSHWEVKEIESDGDEESYIPEERYDRAVIGSDNRVRITDTSAYPFSCIAYMKIHMRCGCSSTGTGYMVGPKTLLTAGHCLMCTDHHQGADYIDFYFGYKDDYNYFLKYSDGTTYWYGTDFPDGYTKGAEQWDYGLVQMQWNVGDTTGYFGIASLTDSDLASSGYNLVGYRNGVMKADYGWVSNITHYNFDHNADTEPGYSGCPLFDNDYYATAINIASAWDNSHNIARRINDELYDFILEKKYE